MDSETYSRILRYLNAGSIAGDVPANRIHNFISTANRYAVSAAGRLMRQGRLVLKEEELEEVWSTMHT